MPQTDVILHLKPLSPLNPIVARRSFHKFYFQLERRFGRVIYQLSKVDPWLKSKEIQDLLSSLLAKANSFILIIDVWLDEGLLFDWMARDADRLWEMVVRYVYKKRGLNFNIAGNEYLQ